MRPCANPYCRIRDGRPALGSARRPSCPVGRSKLVASGGPSPLVPQFLELRIDHVFLGLASGARGCTSGTALTFARAARATTGTISAARLIRRVGTLRHRGGSLCQGLALLLDRVLVVGLEDRPQIAERRLSLGALLGGDFVPQAFSGLST